MMYPTKKQIQNYRRRKEKVERFYAAPKDSKVVRLHSSKFEGSEE
jgi:hypothetical protein